MGAIREAVINSFAHARYDSSVQHEIGVFSNRISILNPGSFANSFCPEDFASRDLHSFLRNESIAKALYLCKDVETFGSGLRKIYSQCQNADVAVTYQNTETDFMLTFSRRDTFIMPGDGRINGTINGRITDLESEILSLIKENNRVTIPELAESCQKSIRSINRAMTSLKAKGLIVRVGSNKTGHWKSV